MRGGRSFGNRIEGNTITGTTAGVFGICYNPADNDPAAPKGDLIAGNLIRGYPAAIQMSLRSDFNVIKGNTLIYTDAGILNENPSNMIKDNNLVKMQ